MRLTTPSSSEPTRGSATGSDIDRELTQAELRDYLRSEFGWSESDISELGDEPIPQGVKYVCRGAPTSADIEAGKRLVKELHL
jgi:hypothetical protein